MSKRRQSPVLLVGGSGVVGSQAARILRRLHPALPITIGGRDRGKAEALAAQLGHADAAVVDLDRADLGLPGGAAHAAIALFVKDDALHSLRRAQAAGVPYVSLSSGLFEIAPEVALHVYAPGRSPILLGHQWLVGAATLAALHFARSFERLESIEIAAVLDEEDIGGPAAHSDYERLMVAPNALILRDGKWIWIGAGEGRRFPAVDGTEMQGFAYSLLDVTSLAAATDARSVRFDVAVGQSSSKRRGQAFSTEIIIELAGDKQGQAVRQRHELVHPGGQAPVTGLCVALAIERLLGLDGGAPVPPGLYLPEVILDPAALLGRLEEFGTRIRQA